MEGIVEITLQTSKWSVDNVSCFTGHIVRAKPGVVRTSLSVPPQDLEVFLWTHFLDPKVRGHPLLSAPIIATVEGWVWVRPTEPNCLLCVYLRDKVTGPLNRTQYRTRCRAWPRLQLAFIFQGSCDPGHLCSMILNIQQRNQLHTWAWNGWLVGNICEGLSLLSHLKSSTILLGRCQNGYILASNSSLQGGHSPCQGLISVLDLFHLSPWPKIFAQIVYPFPQTDSVLTVPVQPFSCLEGTSAWLMCLYLLLLH